MAKGFRLSPRDVAWHRSLYGRITLGYVALITIFVIAQGLLLLWINERNASARPLGISRALGVGLSRRLADRPTLNLDEYVQRVSPENYVFVIMRDGRVAGRRRPSDATVKNVIGDLRRAQGTHVPSTWEQSVYRAVPLIVSGEIVGIVGIAPRTAFEQYGWVVIAIDVGVLAAGTLTAAVLLFRPVRRRIRVLQDAARRVGTGDFAGRAREDGHDEVTELTRAFNSMADELSKREAALEASDRARRQLLADVSHELMTPLTAVLGHLETLQMAEVRLDDERRLRHVAVAQREARRLERVVGDLLDTARLEAGGGSLDVQTVSVANLFDHVIAPYEHDARARHVQLTCQISSPALAVTADGFRLEQALQNVTANAFRHTPNGGRVVLGARAEGDMLVLTVTDSGEGIADDDLPLIFDRFYKASSARSMASHGSGLGLSIVKAIVQRHGGTVAASSVVGQGTTITLRLPGASTRIEERRETAHA